MSLTLRKALSRIALVDILLLMFLLSAVTSSVAAPQEELNPKLQELPDSLQASMQLISPDELQVGDRFQLMVVLSWDDAVVLLPGLLMNDDNEAFEILERKEQDQRRDAKRGAGFLTQRFTFELAAFETGELQLPLVEAHYLHKATGKSRTAEVAAPTVLIAVFPPDDEQAPDIRGIRDAMDPAVNWMKWLMIGAIALGVLAVAAAVLFFWLRRKRKGSRTAPSQPGRPIEEIAFEQLKALEQGRLLSDGKFKEYYGRLSWIVRNYLEERYQFAAVEMTSVEIETVMGEYADSIVRGMIVSFNEHSDLAKFAKWTPSSDEGAEAMSLARNIVARTTALVTLEQTAGETLDAGSSPPLPTFKKDLDQGGEDAS